MSWFSHQKARPMDHLSRPSVPSKSIHAAFKYYNRYGFHLELLLSCENAWPTSRLTFSPIIDRFFIFGLFSVPRQWSALCWLETGRWAADDAGQFVAQLITPKPYWHWSTATAWWHGKIIIRYEPSGYGNHRRSRVALIIMHAKISWSNIHFFVVVHFCVFLWH